MIKYSNICMYTPVVTVFSRRKGPETFCLGVAQNTRTFTFIDCVQFVAPLDFNVLLVNVPGKREVAALLSAILPIKSSLSSCFVRTFHKFLCLWLLHVATVGLYV
jgi:hypothetical protein